MGRKLIRWLIIISLIAISVYYFYPEPKLPVGTKIDQIVVYKATRQLLAYSNGQLMKTYKVSLGGQPIGDKEYEGDKKTPEGSYFINTKNANSGYHKNLGVSYPNNYDIENAKRLGKSAGGDIKIHGLRNGLGVIGKFQRCYNWTAGCMALTNREVDELFDAVDLGARIYIKP